MTSIALSEQDKTVIDRLWNVLSSEGLPPYQAIEQLSNLIVLKHKEKGEKLCLASTSHSQWDALNTVTDEHLVNAVSEQIARLRGASTHSSLFQRAHLVIAKPAHLRTCIQCISELFSSDRVGEWHAHIYDALLLRAEDAARNWMASGGKFYTPHHLAHLLCSLVQPQPGERIGDIACGNGRLLAAAHAYVARTLVAEPDVLRFAPDGQPKPLEKVHWAEKRQALLSQTLFVGMDIDENAVLQAWVRLKLLGIEEPAISAFDTLSRQANQLFVRNGCQKDAFDVLLANPPYSARIDRETLDDRLRDLNTIKSELLFIARALQWLRPGGRAAIIIPDSVLFQQQKAAVALRRTLVNEHGVRAIISLPKGVFAPYTEVKTSILVLTHSGVTNTIWCYGVEHDGYTLDKRRQPTPEQNDLPDLMIKYGLRVSDSLSSLRPSAFIDSDTELQWDNIEPERRTYHVARPHLMWEHSKLGESNKVTLDIDSTRLRTVASPTEQPKDWEVVVNALDRHYTLLPGCYRSQVPYKKRECASREQPSSVSQAPSDTTGRAFERHRLTCIYYVPGVKNLETLAEWHQTCLKMLRHLHRRGQISGLYHLTTLHTLAQTQTLQEREFKRHPPPSDEVTPLSLVLAGKDNSSWFLAATTTLLQRVKQGEVSSNELTLGLELLLAFKECVQAYNSHRVKSTSHCG